MLSNKIKEYLNEYISQEVYVQVAVAKGKNKITTKAAINKYFESNHFKGLTEGKPYNTFLSDLEDKCLGKLLNSPMRDSKTDEGQLGLKYKELEEAMNNTNSAIREKYEKIRKMNLHKMEPIPVCKIPN